MLRCDQCGNMTNNKRFCCLKCTSDWNNSHVSVETNKKRGKKNNEVGRIPLNLFDVSNRTKIKILNRLNCGCSVCGWKEAACDLHHIVPKKKGGTNDHYNLTLLCPNCHRLAHSGKELTLINIQEQFGEAWREHYYSHHQGE